MGQTPQEKKVHAMKGLTTHQIKSELESAIKNREANPDRFNSEFSRGELRAFRETLRRIKQFE